MKVLLFGKKGLLGQEIAEIFKNDPRISFSALSHDDIDISDKEAISQILKDIKPELVINSAAFTYVDECETKPQFAMEINGEANGHLASICNELGAYLMYFSTDYVFDGTKENGYKEDDSPSPINIYGASKLRGEELIQKNTDKFFILRTSWLFGMHGANFVKTMLDLANKKRDITVVEDQIGKPTYTKDLAKAVHSMVTESDVGSGIYHLVNEGETSWYDFAKKIFELAKINVQLAPISSGELDRAARRPQISTLLNTKLPKLRHHHEALHDYLNSLK